MNEENVNISETADSRDHLSALLHRTVRLFQKNTIFIAVVALIILMSILSPYFLTPRNIFNLLRVSSITGLLAIGMMFAILARGIDLSVGSVLALTAAVIALLLGPEKQSTVPLALAILITLAVGAGAGLLNGLVTTKLHVDSFVVTLGMLTIARGATLLLLQGRPAQIGNDFFNGISRSDVFGVPVPVIVFAVVVVISSLILNRTPFGRYVYATGSNPESAFLSGVKTDRIRTLTFVISGLLAALGGIMLASRLFSATPILGEGFELDAIAAVVIGGTSLMGGRGSVMGTVAGVLIIGIVNNGLNLLNVSPYYQLIVRGLILVFAIVLDQFWHRVRR